jgi:hypothetical protein
MDGRVYRTGIADAVVAMEDEGIRRHFPGFTRIRALHGRGIWRGQLRPLAKSYDVVVDMAVGCADARVLYPASVGSVRVLGGGVRPADDGTPVPHLYGPWDDPRGVDLCLYYPPDEDMLLGNQVAEKLLPWAYEWLHYYEIWLVTGVWSGPEAPHPVTETSPGRAEPPRRDRSMRKVKAIDRPLMRSMSYALALPIAADRTSFAAAA